jgi:UDP-N-acetylglucosamine diphosphorylase / glucose-1-phosphate thymidylyltransferase / UDP-N-acetylgalactosamine diphosphorylase / glucosamine-1-phosphate N-acetyltransferase / galactosamine-1-phosphate N-acetyltransferase
MNMQAVVLAGGIGKRIWPLATDKNLLTFLGKSIIEYTLEEVLEAGVKDIILVVNPQNKPLLEKILKKNRKVQGKADLKFAVQKQPKGMADGLFTAEKQIKKKPLLILNAADLFKPNILKSTIAFLKKEETSYKKAVLAGLKVKDYFPGGYFKLKKNKVAGLVEKPGKDNLPSSFFKPVLDYFKNPELLFSYLKKARSREDDLYEAALDNLIKSNNVFVYKIDSFIRQLKYPWHVLDMMTAVFKTRLKKSYISRQAEISSKAAVKGLVFIESGVKVFEGAVIKGPCYIGKNTIIGNNALIRESMIGKGCMVGYNTEIARSWSGSRNFFHCNYIGDSVIEGRSNFGSGARTANFRLDNGKIWVLVKNKDKVNTGRAKLGAMIGKGAKIGINTSIMPGRLIGSNAHIAPGICLYKNVLEDEFAK